MTKSVLISGAGIAGLSAAWQLLELGWQVTIVERATNLRSGGYLMSLSGPGLLSAYDMGFKDALHAQHNSMQTSTFINKKGKKIWSLNYPDALQDIDWITLPRTNLVNILYEAVVDRADILFGTHATKIHTEKDKAFIQLSNDRNMTVDLYIGADGVRSSSRNIIFGTDYTKNLGYNCAAFELTNTTGIEQCSFTYGEPGRLTEFYSLSSGKTAVLQIWKDNLPKTVLKEDKKRVILDAYAGAHPKVLKAILEHPNDQELYFDVLQMIQMPKWSSGRCLLLGDAAHCLTLASGQGASMALKSAAVLGEVLAQYPDVNKALNEHENLLRPLIEDIQSRTKKIIRGYVPSTMFTFWLRNILFRFLPNRWIGSYVIKSIQKEINLTNKVLHRHK